MLKFFRLPFATTGDKTAVPDAVDTNGNVSYSQGYGFDYQRQKTDPAAKNIERDKMNQIFFDVTTAIAELQANGIPDFITTALNGGTAYSYAQYAVVKYSGDLYISLAAANTALPSDATKWALLPTPARIQGAFNSSAVAAGTADALTGAFSPAIAALPAAPGTLSVLVRAGSANTTTTPTFKADGTTAKTIVKGNNQPLAAGDIAGAGHWLDLQYDATLDKWILQNPATPITAPVTGYMLVQDQKANGTNGGSSSAGVQQRTLNTVVANTISGASLASNQVTLPAGTYRVRGYSVNASGQMSQSWLKNVTDTTIAAFGASSAGYNATVFPTMVSEFEGRFTIASAKVFDIQHFSTAAVATTGLGRAVSSGNIEIYASVQIVKES